MSLVGCMDCSPTKRSPREPDIAGLGLCCIGVDRSWSGNLTPPRYEQIQSPRSANSAVANKIIRKGHRRMHTTGGLGFNGRNENTGEPKLVRSGGMRRDWSFEDLRQQLKNRGEEK